MQPDLAIRAGAVPNHWRNALAGLATAWFALLLPTFGAWSEMAHQWWDIDTYNHILLVPPIIAWLVWLRREELALLQPEPWIGGLGWVVAGLGLWLIGETSGINLLAHAGCIAAFQSAVVAMLGVRASLVLAFPILFAAFLAPFGDEIIPVLQYVTARITVGLVHFSGIPAVVDGLFIDTPAGKFVVAEECSGVKFLMAMTALSTLVAWTAFSSWRRRIVLVIAAAIASILANGVRAWGTIFAAQYVGVERAAGIDHIVYGWFFFAAVIALVLGVAWRFFQREPEDAGLTAVEADAHPLAQLQSKTSSPVAVTAALACVAIAFAVIAALV